MYSALLFIYNTISLGIVVMYGLEPLITWIRMKFMREEQLRIARELRATLIREAKERKEARKQKILQSFNHFQIGIGNPELEENTEENPQEVTDHKLERKSRNDLGLDSIKEEPLEETINSVVLAESGLKFNPLAEMNKAMKHDTQDELLASKDEDIFGVKP